MRPIAMFVLFALLTVGGAGCIVHRHGRDHGQARRTVVVKDKHHDHDDDDHRHKGKGKGKKHGRGHDHHDDD